MRKLEIATRDEWRAWLAKNHACETEIWLIFYRKHVGKRSIHYDDAVEEALCFGWIDSLIKRIDSDSYARKFTPRNSGSMWSQTNKQRVEKLVSAGLMTDAGMALVHQAQASGEWDRRRSRPTVSSDVLPDELRSALETHPAAREFFRCLPSTYQKQYVLWIATAKRADTRQRRTTEAIEKLERGERLGLK